ncbi:MAG: hypothetical protein KAR40_11260 [Candidatus Sabulitectum sp.]|nr:hypothetical protein [Candidatus Sabulitectum sp.]
MSEVFEIVEGRPALTDLYGGAILMDDELWYPFRYFANGNIDVCDDDEYAFVKPSSAFEIAKYVFS